MDETEKIAAATHQSYGDGTGASDLHKLNIFCVLFIQH